MAYIFTTIRLVTMPEAGWSLGMSLQEVRLSADRKSLSLTYIGYIHLLCGWGVGKVRNKLTLPYE